MNNAVVNAGFRRDIAWAATAAGILEASAPKAGNVNRWHDFADCLLEDFLLSAVAAGEALGRACGRGVGKTVLEAITLTRVLIPVNTNLGIILLMAPLAKAWGEATSPESGSGVFCPPEIKPGKRLALEAELDKVLAGLTVEDTCDVYQAIRLAAPSGLGHPETGDVYGKDPPAITLLEAMRLAAERDLVAREYVSAYRVTLKTAVPMLEQALSQGASLPQAIAQTQIYLLSRYPDTLIVRKAGAAAGNEVQARARAIWESGGWNTAEGRKMIADFDCWLRQDGNRLNPGTTADIVTNAVFVLLLENGPGFWRQMRQARNPAAAIGGNSNNDDND